MGIGVWHKFCLTGGGATALDGIATASLGDNHVCHVYESGKYYYMVFDADATDAENSPLVVRPDDYSTAGVWKLASSPYGDIQVQPEVVSGLPVEGGISGFDIVRASATTATVTKGSCLDNGGTAQLYADADATVTVPHTGALAANTLYHVYRCLLTGGTQEYRFYTTEANAEADSGVSKRRWLGFLRTNGSSQLCQTLQVRDLIIFLKASENVVSAGITTTYAAVTHSAFIPDTRIAEIEYGSRDATVSPGYITASDDGINLAFLVGYTSGSIDDTVHVAWRSAAYNGGGRFPYNSGRYFRSSTGTLDLLIHSVRVKR